MPECVISIRHTMVCLAQHHVIPATVQISGNALPADTTPAVPPSKTRCETGHAGRLSSGDEYVLADRAPDSASTNQNIGQGIDTALQVLPTVAPQHEAIGQGIDTAIQVLPTVVPLHEAIGHGIDTALQVLPTVVPQHEAEAAQAHLDEDDNDIDSDIDIETTQATEADVSILRYLTVCSRR
jgi:hypothetical protein